MTRKKLRKKTNEDEDRAREEELTPFEQDWRTKIAEQARISDVVEELAMKLRLPTA